MAVGDVTVFNEALAYMIDGGWEAADQVAIDLIVAASTPLASDVTPAVADYTFATSTEGEQVLDTLANCVTQTAGTMTFDDTGASVTWAQATGGSTTCRWAYIFNTTEVAGPGICFVDLGSNRDLTAGSITLTWNASGIFTIA
jgi:hypothetical protein